jgi:hypothetical protein
MIRGVFDDSTPFGAVGSVILRRCEWVSNELDFLEQNVPDPKPTYYCPRCGKAPCWCAKAALTGSDEQ